MSLKKNFIMNVILTMSSLIFPLITFPYISRVILPDGTGKVSFAVSFVTYFIMVSQLGIPTYGIRACTEVRENRCELSKTVHELLFINLIMSMATYIVFGVMIYTVPQLQEDKTLYVIASSAILLNCIGIEWLYKALEKYTYITIRSIAFKLIALISMLLLVREKEDYVIYGAITIFSAYGSMILNFVNAKKYIDFSLFSDYKFKKHLKPILVFFAISFAATIYTNMDTVILGFLSSDKEVGLYTAAIKVKSILVSFVTALGAVLLPRLSYYVSHNMEHQFKATLENVVRFVFVIAVPLAVYFILFADPVVRVLAGTAFEGAVLPMQIIMIALILIGITNILGLQILTPMGREKTIMVANIGGCIVDLAINIILIPKLGATGAAIASVSAELAVLIVEASALKKEITAIFKRVEYWKILLATVIASVISIGIKMWIGIDIAVILCTAIAFFGSYLLMLFVEKEKFVQKTYSQAVSRFLKK